MRRVALAAVVTVLASLPVKAGPDILRERTVAGIAYKRIPLGEAPMQTIQFLWLDGSPLALAGKAALSALGPAMMHEGPRGEKRGEIQELMSDLQASFRFAASGETVTLTLTAPPESLPAAANVLKRFLEAPGFPERRLETHRRARILGTRQSLASGDTIAGQLRLRFLLEPGAHRDFLRIDPEHYATVSVADVADWKARVMARDTAIIATSGPVGREAIAAEIDKLVGVLPERARRSDPPPLAFRSFGKRIVYEKPDAAQTIIVAYGPTTIAPGRERFKADLALARLGGGAQGRLFRVLREKLGATYGVSAGTDQMALGRFAFAIRTSVSHDKAAAVIEEIGREYRRWREDGVTDAELQAAKSQARSSWSESMKQPGTVASMAVLAEVIGLGDVTFADFAAAREAVTREEINAYIRAHFPQWPLGLVIVAPKADGLGADCVIKALEEAARCE